MSTSNPIQPRDWKEGRRLRAWELYGQGWRQSAIATALGVTPGAVSQWIKRAHEGDVASLCHRPPSGRPAKLTAAQRTQLPNLLAQGAEAFGFRGQVWTTPRVAEVINRKFGVRYHPAHISRLLRTIGWSPQKPVQRATQRNEDAIAAWYAERWPALKKRPTRKVAPLSG